MWEFDRLHSSGEPPSSELGLEKDNKRKNRYCDVLPFDYNCVTLGKERRYINASFLKSKDSEPAQWSYIATQVGCCLQKAGVGKSARGTPRSGARKGRA